jgi:hypothetical protein
MRSPPSAAQAQMGTVTRTGLREEHRDHADAARGETATHGWRALAEIECDECQPEYDQHVGAVLLELPRVPYEWSGDREQRNGDRYRDPLECSLGDTPEQKEPGDAAEEGEESQRHVAGPEQLFGDVEDRQKAERRGLGVAERVGEQLRKRSLGDVARDRELVEPHRRVREVLPHSKRNADRQNREEHTTVAK